MIRATTTPKKLRTDEGKEFYNNTFKKYLEYYNIELYCIFNEGKAAMAKRMIRSVKEKMYRTILIIHLHGNLY